MDFANDKVVQLKSGEASPLVELYNLRVDLIDEIERYVAGRTVQDR